MPATHPYTTFHLAGLLFGLPAAGVLELTRHRELTRVPLAPAMIEGLLNLRGQLVTAIDLRRRLALPPRPAGTLPMNVVLLTADGPVSLIVDDIGEVIELDAETFEPPPESVRGVAREVIVGVCKLPDRLLLILDATKVVTLTSLTAAPQPNPATVLP